MGDKEKGMLFSLIGGLGAGAISGYKDVKMAEAKAARERERVESEREWREAMEEARFERDMNAKREDREYDKGLEAERREYEKGLTREKREYEKGLLEEEREYKSLTAGEESISLPVGRSHFIVPSEFIA